MSSQLTKVLLYPILAAVMFAAPLLGQVSAQVTEADKLERERQLRSELQQVLEEIEAQKAELREQRAQSNSIQRDIAILDAQIREAQLELQASNLRIEQLSGEIQVKAATISELEDKTIRQKESLSKLLRQMREVDDYSLVEVFLANKNLSEFFKESDSLASIKERVLVDLEQIAKLQEAAAQEKAELEMVKNEQEVVTNKIAAEKDKIEVSQDQKEVLLSASREQEKTYEQIVAEREAKAAEIRSALFSLRDAGNINFGQALDYARIAESGTGVRPAFLLAIITQESNLGKNVGSCVIADLSSGQTKSVNSGKVFSNGIHPTRDLHLLQSIVTELGRDPLETKVSCPIGGTGYGGAMGPAQFIPSTWNSYAGRVSSITGSVPANPWNARDAFTASSLFLSDLGAGKRTYDAEWEAAARYYAGGGWQTRGVHYANSVLNIAADIQRQIDTLDSL